MNPETGKGIGNRTIRDTIFIQQLESGYEVSNTKWMLNDYSNQGWQSMEHSSDRPMPTYIAQFQEQNNLLPAELTPAIFLDIQGKKLFKAKKVTNLILRFNRSKTFDVPIRSIILAFA